MSNIDLNCNWKRQSDVKYIGAYSFDDNEIKTLTIKDVNRETVVGNNGQSSECLVIYFVEPEKPMVLNRTNAKMLDHVCHTTKMSGWIGKKICLGVEHNIRLGRDRVDGVRVLDRQPVMENIPHCAECGKPITAFGKMTAAQVATASQQKFGKCLCVECGQKTKA